MIHQSWPLAARLLFIGMTSASGFAAAQESLNIVYPADGSTVRAGGHIWVFGNVSPPGTPVRVAGMPARGFANGTFYARVPIGSGEIRIGATAASARDSVHFRIPQWTTASPKSPATIDTTWLYPRRAFVVEAGETIALLAKGSPASRMSARIGTIADSVALVEYAERRPPDLSSAVFAENRPPAPPRIRGGYTRLFTVPGDAPPGSYPVEYSLRTSDGGHATRFAPAELTVRSPSQRQRVIVREPAALGDPQHVSGAVMFFPEASLVQVAARDDDDLQIALSGEDRWWLPRRYVSELPSPVPYPNAVSAADTDSGSVQLELGSRLPYRIAAAEAGNALLLTVFSGSGEPTMPEPEIAGHGIAAVPVATKSAGSRAWRLINPQRIWGYDAHYRGTTLVLKIKSRRRGLRSLEGLRVAIDPGHGPDSGVRGATGSVEAELTAVYAAAVETRLRGRGAHVLLTRSQETGSNLVSRKLFAQAAGADLLISLHFNSLPDGLSPLRRRGSSTYWYHEHSRPLAQAVHARMLRRGRLRDFGIYRRNLSICRVTQLPAIIVETAFLIQPYEERQALSPSFRNAVATAIVEGIADFMRETR